MEKINLDYRRALRGVTLLLVFFGWVSVSAQPNTAVVPQRAFAGGQLVGMVIDPAGAPVAQSNVQVSSTLSGAVYEAESGDDGSFAVEVPEMEDEDENESIDVGVTGLATSLAIALITSLPEDASWAPPTYTEVGRETEVVGNWPEVVFEPGTSAEPTGEPVELPLGRSISPDGQDALTTYYALPSLPIGTGRLALTDTEGNTMRTQTHVYSVVSASLDQERLSSGQETEFVYEFYFGEGEEQTIPITIDIEGPIRYEMNGIEQFLEVDPEGNARLAGTIQAIQGSPTGIPFAINANVGFAAGAFTDDKGNAWNYCPGRCYAQRRSITDTDGRRVEIRSRSRANNTCTCSCVLFDMNGPKTVLVEEDQTYDDNGDLEGSEWVTVDARADYSCRCVEKQ